jgi:hypothetical protein
MKVIELWRPLYQTAMTLALTGLIPGVVAAEPGRGAISVITVEGSGLGPVPDGAAGDCETSGALLDVVFNVPSFVGRVADVEVVITFNPGHTWAGDVTARLINPAGLTHFLFGRVGATTALPCGDSSNLVGPYLFSDSATPASGGFWQAASAASDAAPIQLGSYRTTNTGGPGAVNPMPPTSLRASFAGQAGPTASVWTLRMNDYSTGDTGALSSATLLLYFDETIFRGDFEITE